MQDSAAADCASPAVCIKDSLYPLRKELLNKPTPSRSTKPGARKTPKNGRTLSSTPITRARSKETVINSPWLITDGAADDKKANNNCANTDELKKKYCGETGEMKETEGGASAVQSCIKTRGQKRKFPLKENIDVYVSLFFQFRRSVDLNLQRREFLMEKYGSLFPSSIAQNLTS